jgi:transcription termination factor NusB
MWSKGFRKCIICAVYQQLFWESFNNTSYKPNWEMIASQNKKDDDVFTDSDLDNTFSVFTNNKPIFVEKITQYINKWDKTFDIVKACLLVFLMELDAKPDDNTKVVGNYIKFAQEFAGGENPSLVHAVISKILEDKSDITK